MALERFIPKSPDIFIRNSQDFEVAKFGHLNTIVEYINSYIGSDSLQLAGSGPITSTARYISDSTGIDSAISISNIAVGIGTTAPISPLNVYNSSSSVSSIILVEQDTSAIIGQINQYRKNGSVNLISGAEIGRLSFGGYFNSTYSPFSQVCSAVLGYYGGTGTDRVGGLRLVTWNGGGQTTRIQVSPDGKIGIGTTAPSAKLSIIGDGSTSATTSLLVQNSAGTDRFKIQDDGTTTLTVSKGTITNSIIGPEARIAIIPYSASIGTLFNSLSVNGGANYPVTFWSTDFFAEVSGGLQIATSAVSVNASAKLQVDSTTRGFLPPRMTTTQINAIVSPAEGLVAYNTTISHLCCYQAGAWVKFNHSPM